MSFAVIQKNYIPLHGGSVEWEGKGIIISGVSGSGKSTVAMELLHQGFRFVADDMSVLDLVDGKAQVLPGFPQQKLCRNVAEKSGLNLEKLIYIDEDRDKFARNLEDGYVTEPLPVACMIELRVLEDAKRVVIEEVSGASKFSQLIRNVYRGEIYQRLNNKPERFQTFVKATACIPMYRITRPKHGDFVHDIIQCIRESILYMGE
jgi:hypothetical protein